MIYQLTARTILITAVCGLLLSAQTTQAQDCSGTYTVQRGDTLFGIARRFGTTLDALVRANRIANPNRLFVGQVLSLPGGPNCSAPTTGSGSAPGGPLVHVVQRGETLARIAARYGVSLSAIVAANNIANPSRIFAGQRLTIPGTQAPAQAPAAIPGLVLSTAAPEQGRTLWLAFPAAGLATVGGSLGPWPILFFRDGDRFVGLVGIYALSEPGEYPLKLALTDAGGKTTEHTQSVRVADGGYRRENINLSPSTSQLLDPALTIPERERVIALVTPASSARLWTSLFQLPAAGRITSAFGTRRSYNGGPVNSFHGGTDFSVNGGLDIRTPAPGVVVLAEALVVRGNTTMLDHGWGVYSGFYHQSEIYARPGEVVQAGQLIGKIGGTGLATGPHLHWEMWVNTIQVDPMQWTRQAGP
jgi:murein DD-endopeptidase MepM/ murein hydrolase activator NlpD